MYLHRELSESVVCVITPELTEKITGSHMQTHLCNSWILLNMYCIRMHFLCRGWKTSRPLSTFKISHDLSSSRRGLGLFMSCMNMIKVTWQRINSPSRWKGSSMTTVAAAVRLYALNVVIRFQAAEGRVWGGEGWDGRGKEKPRSTKTGQIISNNLIGIVR
jgi:hypothetical protein